METDHKYPVGMRDANDGEKEQKIKEVVFAAGAIGKTKIYGIEDNVQGPPDDLEIPVYV